MKTEEEKSKDILMKFAYRFNDRLDYGDGLPISEWMIDEFIDMNLKLNENHGESN